MKVCPANEIVLISSLVITERFFAKNRNLLRRIVDILAK